MCACHYLVQTPQLSSHWSSKFCYQNLKVIDTPSLSIFQLLIKMSLSQISAISPLLTLASLYDFFSLTLSALQRHHQIPTCCTYGSIWFAYYRRSSDDGNITVTKLPTTYFCYVLFTPALYFPEQNSFICSDSVMRNLCICLSKHTLQKPSCRQH